MTEREGVPGAVADQPGHGETRTVEAGETIEKRFHLWRLLAWLLGVMVALMGVAAAVDLLVLGF